MQTKRCPKCDLEKTAGEFGTDKRAKDGLYFCCRSCYSVSRKRRPKTPEQKARAAESTRRYRERHPERVLIQQMRAKFCPIRSAAANQSSRKYARSEKGREYRKAYYLANKPKMKARDMLNTAVKAGKIIKPDRCDRCGMVGERIQGHHHKGYEPEHWLDVQWLCESCHMLAHGKTPLALKKAV